MSRTAFMLRFTLSHPDLDTTIVGTRSIGHLRDNLAAAADGPLPGRRAQRSQEQAHSRGRPTSSTLKMTNSSRSTPPVHAARSRTAIDNPSGGPNGRRAYLVWISHGRGVDWGSYGVRRPPPPGCCGVQAPGPFGESACACHLWKGSGGVAGHGPVLVRRPDVHDSATARPAEGVGFNTKSEVAGQHQSVLLDFVERHEKARARLAIDAAADVALPGEVLREKDRAWAEHPSITGAGLDFH